MARDDQNDLGAPGRPLRDRAVPPGGAPVRTVRTVRRHAREPATVAAAVRTRARRRRSVAGELMRMVGLTVQAVVIAAVLLLGLAYEDRLRAVFDIPEPSGASPATIAALQTEIETLSTRQMVIADNLAKLRRDLAADGETTAGTVATRLRVLERLVARVESKLDELRDAQLFPAAGSPTPQAN